MANSTNAAPASSDTPAQELAIPNLAAPLALGASLEQFCAAHDVLSQERFQRLKEDHTPSENKRYEATYWTKLAEMAPPEIQPDLQQVAGHWEEIVAGTVDPREAVLKTVDPMRRYARWTGLHCPQTK